jgi:uncharacterized protein YciI
LAAPAQVGRGDEAPSYARSMARTLWVVRRRRGGPWDWSRDLREQDGWDEHARIMDQMVVDGFILLGGPLEGHREVLHIVEAASKEEVEAKFAEDNWTANGMLTTVSVEGWTTLLDGVRV